MSDLLEKSLKAKDETIEIEDEAVLVAKNVFNIDYLYPWQRLVIANIMDAYREPESEVLKKQIVLLPTGAGKSLCFLIPSMLLEGATLVMYPLLALMSDQKRRMDEGGISNVVFQGGQTEEEREENFKKIENGAKIILANPEVLQNENLVERLAKCKICHAAIDEAHCVSEWGDSFRPAYLTLGKILKKLNIPIITAFTATASPPVLKRVAEILFNGEAHTVRSESDRANIHYNVVYAYSKKNMIFHLVLTEKRPMIIFCGTRNAAESTARDLQLYFSFKNHKENYDIVRFYHAGLSREEKTEVEKWFFPKDNAILCCTCAFGMGVDKKNVRTVIHRDVPSTIESFIQESGRGARDGGIAQSYLLWNYSDYEKFSSFEHNSRQRIMLKFAESKTCRRQVLLDALDAEQAACLGCDICKAKTNLENRKTFKKKSLEYLPPSHISAKDRNYCLKIFKRYSKSWDKDESVDFFEKKLNAKTKSFFSVNIWESSDVVDIINQLLSEQKIYVSRWPWKNKIAYVKRVKK